MILTIHLDNPITIALIAISIISYSLFIFQMGRKYQHKNQAKVSSWMK
jgi:hypothetical protein